MLSLTVISDDAPGSLLSFPEQINHSWCLLGHYPFGGRDTPEQLEGWFLRCRCRNVSAPVNDLSRLKGDIMGKEARIGLLLGAAACLLAVMVDYVVEELR